MAKNHKKKTDKLIARAVELRATGATLAAIGTALGASPSTVCQWLQDAYRASPRRTPEAVEEYLAGELAVLDALQGSYLVPAMEGDVRACDAVLAIMDRRSKYLGLYAPTKAEHDLRLGGAGFTGSTFKTKEEKERELRAAIAARRAMEQATTCGGSPGRPR